ncbi:MAG: carboxypeptidase-like regulatory domain-containing protein [Gammaproteobacteria bacterium]|nr:carboxypeptidase-like regulatory domain-containing protein [Gammaproteobacteria bacterium]
MRVFWSLLLVFIVFDVALLQANSSHVTVRLGTDRFDGNEIWVGVVQEESASSPTDEHWIRESYREFSVEIPAGSEKSALVFLKRNFAPVVVPLTRKVMEEGFDLDFSTGISVMGSVTTVSGNPIGKGSVFLSHMGRPAFSPPNPDLFTWEVEEDGSFEIGGLLPDRGYKLTASAQEFMPASHEIVLLESEQEPVVNFLLARATYLTGHIVDRHGSTVRGTLDAVVTPEESQTLAVEAEFDLHNNFRIGPFAEGALVELTASGTLDRKSRPVEIESPAEHMELLILRWVTLVGTVLNSDTGEPVETFRLRTNGKGEGDKTVDVFAPGGEMRLEIDDMSQTAEIIAPDFLWWKAGSSMTLEGRESYDLGTIELHPAHTIRGRITDNVTQLPIEGAEVRRIEIHKGNVSHWTYANVFATTNAEGEFEVKGFPDDGGLVSIRADAHKGVDIPVVDVETYLEVGLDPWSHVGGSISGHVVSLDGEPVYPAYVQLGWSGARNEEDGSFSFELTGRYELSASAESGRSKVIEGTLESGEHIAGLELVLIQDGHVQGTVQGLVGNERAWIDVDSFRAVVESDGSYEMYGVSIGVHLAKCTTSTGRQLAKSIEMGESMDVRLDFAFVGNSSLSGQVRAAGAPAPILDIQAKPLNTAHVGAQATTKVDGTFAIEGLSDGKYRLVVSSRGVSRNVNVAGDTQVDIDLGSTELSGRVRSSKSVLGVHVYLTGHGRDGRFQQHTTVDNSGYYRFWGVQSGNYEITAAKHGFKTKSRRIDIQSSMYNLDITIQPTNLDRKDQDLRQLEVFRF